MNRALALFLPMIMAHALAVSTFAQSGPYQPPAVNLLSLPNGSFIPGPTDILVAANTSDSDGTVVSIEFFANDESLGLGYGISTPLFSFFWLLWSDVQPGEYDIVAKATDDDGASTESDPFHMTVFSVPDPPVVSSWPPIPRPRNPIPSAPCSIRRRLPSGARVRSMIR